LTVLGEEDGLRLKLIACEILYRELCWAVARSPNRIDLEFMPKGLHDIGQDGMQGHLRDVLASVDESNYDAVLFGYGLCSNGLVGLTARTVPLVIPRAHDCITLFFGSKQRYLDYFLNNPGVYFKTSGWIERGTDLDQLAPHSIQEKSGLAMTYEELVAKYGEDNAQFLHEQLGDLARNYHQLTFIEMGVEPDGRFEGMVRQDAQERGWKFEKLQGDLSLIQRLVDGPWNEADFLVLSPGHRVASSFDEKIITAERATT
jgi:hypothetical protein